LLKYVEARRGRLILSGDTRQHGPVEASDALRAIERYSGLCSVELDEIRRQDPKRGETIAEKERIRQYREAVKEASKGNLVASFNCLEQLGVVVECSVSNRRDKLAESYVRHIERGESAIIVSQTWEEIHGANEKIREALRTKQLLSGKEHFVTSLERLDLTEAQKQDARFYPEDHVIVFNKKIGRFARGDQGRLIGVTGASAVIEANGKVRLVKARYFDRFSVCRPRPLSLCPGDRIQLKANGNAVNGESLANGEVVTVSAMESNGTIRLRDGRVLSAHYRQFVHGYAVTSYGSQGKTVDYVLFADSAVTAATNAQQWYVTISRGRKGVEVFTTDKHQLRENIEVTGDRQLALEMEKAAKQSNDRRRDIPVSENVNPVGISARV
jgi:ATP-dependent exoDNAse (exonuclease V) alpha subunit